MDNYKTKAGRKPKSRSEQRRQAVQRGKKLPTFGGSKVKPAAADPHLHVTPAAHKKVVDHAKKTGVKYKEAASELILR